RSEDRRLPSRSVAPDRANRMEKSWADMQASGTPSSQQALVPHLSLCLRTLSRRRMRVASLSRFGPDTVHVPESFRGGCSFGAGQAGLSRYQSPNIALSLVSDQSKPIRSGLASMSLR